MNVAALLNDLRRRGVEFELVDGRLVSRAPKGILTPELTATLREQKQHILAFLQEGSVDLGGTSRIPPIRPIPRQEFMPLSFSQERLWYLNQVDENPAVYNLPLAFRILGRVRFDVLQRCLDAIEARHEALRTTVVVRNGEPFQCVHDPRGLPLAVIDLRAGYSTRNVPSALEALAQEAMAPFDLAVGPLVRATLIRTTEEEQYFIVVVHHVIADGISTQIFLKELVALYEAFLAGRPSPLEPLPVQFVDYAVWQRSWLEGPALEEQLSYWKERLAGDLPALEVTPDHPRPPIRTANGSKEPLRLPRYLVDGLTAVGREEGATLYMVLLALFKALLHRYSGAEDIILGTPVANRTRAESEGIIGFIANTLVLRTRLDGAPTFREVVRRVRDGCISAFRHQDMPFQKIVEVLNPVRDLSRTPIFQGFFTFHETTSQADRMGDLTLEPVVAGSNVSRMDLSLFLRELDGEVLGSLEYNTDIFDRDTIVRMIRHYVELAGNAAAEPDRRIANLNLLTNEEWLAFARWNATEQPYPAYSLHQLVELQARSTPDRVAVRTGSVSLSFRELDERSDRLARVLRVRGVRSGNLVGVCVDRSVDLIPALLAVGKAGAAYVPMDPEFPESRLAFMAADAQVALVLTQRALLDRLPNGPFQTLCLDDPAVRCEAPAVEIASVNDPESLAYVIYTSGSTGKPKGVEVRHRNVGNLLAAMRERPGVRDDDVLVAVTTLSFDIAVLELFLPLTVGGQVVVAPRETAMDGAALATMLREAGATMMQATPATWRLLLDSGWEGQPGLKALAGGEALPADLARRLIPVVGELWNMYGPTETTVWSTCARLDDAAAPITIGSPIGNTVIRVIGKDGQHVPIGVPGELYIGGAGVAKGYRGRPALTAERFVSDPLPTERSATRFYRTGDLVKLNATGALECLGRLDDQVKVQGFRIELGEIESVLASLPEIREAAVSVHSDTGGDARLVAYVVYHPGHQLTMSEVRRHLREHLPSYMVPGLVADLGALPRTPNGKIDRKALPNPLTAGVIAREFVPPVSPAERIVAEEWSALLPVERVGRHDNFFELGGHSLLSIRAVAAIERRTGRRLDPRLMFFQTLEQIAVILEPELTARAS